MSLKFFHLVFITCAGLLALGTGYWALTQTGGSSDVMLGALSALVLILLIPYGIWFRRKMWNGGAS
jgi:hypothetical protein